MALLCPQKMLAQMLAQSKPITILYKSTLHCRVNVHSISSIIYRLFGVEYSGQLN